MQITTSSTTKQYKACEAGKYSQNGITCISHYANSKCDAIIGKCNEDVACETRFSKGDYGLCVNECQYETSSKVCKKTESDTEVCKDFEPRSSGCQTCTTGYQSIDGKKCFKYTDNCKEYSDSYTCKTCEDGFYYNANLKSCVSCSIITGCKTRSNASTCTTCEDGYYGANCDSCSIAMPDCKECSDAKTCEDGFITIILFKVVLHVIDAKKMKMEYVNIIQKQKFAQILHPMIMTYASLVLMVQYLQMEKMC